MGYDMYWRKKDDAEAAAVNAADDQFHAAVRERDQLPEGERGTMNMERVKRDRLDFDSHEAYDGRTARYAAAQDKVMAASAARYAAEQSYFRLNISGMGWARAVMERFGMVFDDPTLPDFPSPGDFGTDYDHVDAVKHPGDYPGVMFTDEKLRAAVKYREALDGHLAWHGIEIPGIPLHKFGSNDGWIVLPAEAEAATRIWKTAFDEMGEDKARAIVAGGDSPGNELSVSADDADRYWSLWLRWIAFLAGSVRHDGFEVH